MAEELNKEVEKAQEKNIEAEQKSKSNMWKKISLFVSIGLIIILIALKAYNPDFPLVWIFIIGGIAVGIFIIGFSGLSLYKKAFEKAKEKFKGKTEIPEAKNPEDLWKYLEDSVNNERYQNHIVDVGEVRRYNIKKEFIYEFIPELLYKDKEEVHILVNAHEPHKQIPTIVSNPSKYEIKKLIPSMIIYSEYEEPGEESERTFGENPLTGGRYEIIRTRKGQSKKENKGEIKNKKEDIA